MYSDRQVSLYVDVKTLPLFVLIEYTCVRSNHMSNFLPFLLSLIKLFPKIFCATYLTYILRNSFDKLLLQKVVLSEVLKKYQ